MDCKSCDGGRHIFCDLYRAGLIGIIGTDSVNGELVQEFPPVGDSLFLDGHALPPSERYLIHPVLNDKIKSKNPQFTQGISRNNIIGFDRPWHEPQTPTRGRVSTPHITFDHVDMAVLAIREDEHRAILSSLGRGVPYPGANRSYTIHTVQHEDGNSIVVAVVRVPRPGPGKAQSTAHSAIEDLDPTWVILQGIAGATPDNDYTLGDVIVGSHLHSFTVGAVKANGQIDFEDEGGHMTPRAEDLIALLPALDAQMAGWESLEGRPVIDPSKASLYGPDDWCARVMSSLVANKTRSAPIALMRGMACSPFLVKNTELLEQWRESARDIAAVEMELAGVYEAARHLNREYSVLAIRGISDIVGLDREDVWTRYAAKAAASYTAKLISQMPPHYFDRPA